MLTLVVPEKYYIQTRDNSQEIGHGMMPITNKFWVKGRWKKIELIILDNFDQSHEKEVVLNNNLARFDLYSSISAYLSFTYSLALYF